MKRIALLLVCICVLAVGLVAHGSPDSFDSWVYRNVIPPGYKKVKCETVWVGEYHYSRAKLGSGGEYADTGRRWGWNSTSANTGWVAFALSATAYTYWGH